MNKIQFTTAGSGTIAKSVLNEYISTNRLKKRNLFAFYEPLAIRKEYISSRATIQQLGGHDLFSKFCYKGTVLYLRDSFRSFITRFVGWDEIWAGGTTFNSATLGLQHILLIALYKFANQSGFDLIKNGLQVCQSRPVILAPIHMRFVAEAIATAANLGNNSCRFYNLGRDYHEDFSSLEDKVKSCASANETIIINLMFGGGDTTRGLPQQCSRIIDVVEQDNRDGYKPYNVVDAASHFFNAWASGIIDLDDQRIRAVIINPQKCGAVLGSTLAIFRDIRDLNAFADVKISNACDTEEKKLDLMVKGSWMITKDASGAMSFFNVLHEKGTDWLKIQRLRALDNAKYFRTLLHERKDLFRFINSSSTVGAFQINSTNPRRNRYFAEKVNSSDDVFIGYDQTLRARTNENVIAGEEQLIQKQYSQYDGLWATFYPFQTRRDVERMFSQLVEIAKL